VIPFAPLALLVAWVPLSCPGFLKFPLHAVRDPRQRPSVVTFMDDAPFFTDPRNKLTSSFLVR